MGLDQFAYKVKKIKALTDLSFPESALIDKDFDYWRKFYGLQAWAENLYHEKGGTKNFNCTYVRFTEQDLDRLERDMQENEFYQDRYCDTVEEEKFCEFRHLKDFIQAARKAIAEGYAVYYSSWW